ncbi:MAG: hypothetical protein EOM19_05325, partial [Candidatus Moranbacteria bacterium]|nr:hypothetical protein [Candidatus Moranbacteria bacterium]
IEHPTPSNWNKYASKDTQILLGDSLTLTSQPQTLLQTTDTHFSEGTKTDLGILGSGNDASLGLLSALGSVAQVASGDSHTCALKTDGTVWCWGRNNYGQLGDNTTTDRYTPVQVLGVEGNGFLEGVSQISAGDTYTCALKTDGTVWCWGRNNNGQFGDNTTTDKYTPVQVLGVEGIGFLEGVSQISAGESHTCATKTDGTVYCWGSNSSGRLGDNTTTQRLAPVQVVGVGGSGFLENILQISAKRWQTCALKIDSTVFCWGSNSNGKLGDNTTTDKYTPVQVLGVGGVGFLEGISQINLRNHACALKIDSTVFCWGSNSYGALGDNTMINRSTPVQVFGVEGTGFMEGVVDVSVGSSYSCSLTANNTVLCWGYNLSGQLGDNTSTHRRLPAEVLDETSTFLSFTQNAIQVASGSNHSVCSKKTLRYGVGE